MADTSNPAPETAEVAAPAKAKPKPRPVRLRTRIGEILDLSGHGLGVITEAGADFSPEDADNARTIARKAGVVVDTVESGK